jgi:hypothetical protein
MAFCAVAAQQNPFSLERYGNHRSTMRGFCQLVVAAILVPGSRVAAQTIVPDADVFRARAAAYMREAAVRPLPLGDTLLTWHAGGPVLFHTAVRDSGGVRAGLLRNDRMLGIADVRWSAGAPSSFRASWFTVKAGVLDSTTITAVVRDRLLMVARTIRPDTTVTLPLTAWAVADYGMEELLLPAFEAIGKNLPYQLAVLRPYALKWDTLVVTERTRVAGRGWDVVTYSSSDEQWRLAIENNQHVLWLRRSRHPDDDKRPMDGTARGASFLRLLPVLKPATEPTAP